MTPGWWFSDDLERLSKSFDPAHWSGDRPEIEFAFGELEIRLQDEQRAERRVFVQGYDQRAIDQATGEILQRQGCAAIATHLNSKIVEAYKPPARGFTRKRKLTKG